MPAHRPSTRGFTLVELLVVIAIIGILAGFIAMVLPRAIEKAKIARLTNTFTQMRNALTEYYVDHNSYPPAYGYLDRNAAQALKRAGINLRTLTEADLNTIQTSNAAAQASFLGYTPASPIRLVYTTPWLHYLGYYNNRDVYDKFSIGYDTDMNQAISRLEFSPIVKPADPGAQTYNFANELYIGTNLSGQVDLQLNANEERPLIYIPVNQRQARKVASAFFDLNPNDPRPRAGQINAALQNMEFPPPSYDAYVLISVGPAANTGGIPLHFGLPGVNLNDYDAAFYYHVLGMLTYFMASRDAENQGRGDGELDFDFRGRVRGTQRGGPFYNLPDGSAHPGPIIFVGKA